MLSTALDETARRRDEIEDRGEMAARLRQRKLNNTRTSIVLGHSPAMYETDAMARGKDAVGHKQSVDREGARELKKQLTASHFSTNLEGLPGVYRSAAAEAQGRGMEGLRYGSNIEKCRGVLDDKAAKMTRKSSVIFGTAPPLDYTLTSESALKHVVDQITDTDRKAASTADAKRLKMGLSRQHFTFAHPQGSPEQDARQEAMRFQTTSRIFAYDPQRAGVPKHVRVTSCKADTLADSVDFGHESVTYRSTTHEALALMETGVTAADRQNALLEQRENRQRIATLKKELLKTSVVIGADDEYM